MGSRDNKAKRSHPQTKGDRSLTSPLHCDRATITNKFGRSINGYHSCAQYT
ncbi:hypothetical protein HUN01_21655 [Nostoc edaphicum CCNP1411]|uniref:Uncharacterized protein n=1 Tax=Nostoc edaphicum CCNP1411 TaxID=1472755 RepID=A0A7D7LGE7_9NOSO|nr:hypothetical protein [Nostoc edaphicum]QMS90071.1 hypothetical protein HUN01_21655 [Nostoc edaphicum CCNP1411]